MSCYHPSRVPIRRKSVFKGLRLQYTQEVPCGSCLGCRKEQGRQWAVRIMHEVQFHDVSYFVTLTYNDDELPRHGSLRADDFSRFVKDLRRAYPQERVSYYGCGEYGGSSQRPHYHAVLFGVDFLDKCIDVTSTSDDVWRSQSLEDVWGRGRCQLGSVTMASASYIAKYVRKKIGPGSQDKYEAVIVDTGELVDRRPEFSRMSLKPAIGKEWIQNYWRDVYPRDFVVVDGHEAKPPRFYDKWMDEHLPFVMDHVRQERYANALDLTKYQLNAMEVAEKSRADLYDKRLAI